MKRIILTVIAAATLLTLAASCNKDNEVRDYDFIISTAVEVADAGRASVITDTIFADHYFNEVHSYNGTFEEAVNQAAREFAEHVKNIDEAVIESNLVYGEYASLSLWSMDPGSCLLTYKFTYGSLNETN